MNAPASVARPHSPDGSVAVALLAADAPRGGAGGVRGRGSHRLAVRRGGAAACRSGRRICPSRPTPRPPGFRSGGPKTDRTDARRLRELLAAGRLSKSWIAPEWIAPEPVLDMRARDLPGRSTANHRCRNRGGQWADPYRNSPPCTSVGV